MLNKFFRPMSHNQYLDEFDIPATNHAIVMAFSGMTDDHRKAIERWIWEDTSVKPFGIFQR